MPRLSEHEGSGAIGILKAGCVYRMSPDIIIAIRQLYSAQSVSTIFTLTIPFQSATVSARCILGLQG